MEHLGKIKKTTIVTVSLWAAVLALTGPAAADPKDRSSPTSVEKPGSAFDDSRSVQPGQGEKDGPGIKGFALSFGDTGNEQVIRIKTAFLVKPLKTDNFFVALATSAPLLDRGVSRAAPHDTMKSQPFGDGSPTPGISNSPGAAPGWMVIGGLPESTLLDPGSRNAQFNWLPDLEGDGSWQSKVEFIFLPADQWTVRAILSMAHDTPEDRQRLSSDENHATRIGMGIDVDYRIFKSIALGIDYDHYRYGNAFTPAPSEANSTSSSSDTNGSRGGESIAARLTIRF